MLAGKEPKLLQEALEYVIKRRRVDSGEGRGSHHSEALSPNVHQETGFLPISEDVYSSFPPTFRSLSNSVKTSSYRIGSIPATQELHHSAAARKEQRRLKTALAELYASFQRSCSFAELMISKVDSNRSRGSIHHADVSVGQRTQGMDTSGGMKEPESYPWRQQDSKSRGETHGIDWKSSFQCFDHRRLVTFGVCHNLMRRVHDFPYAVKTAGKLQINETRQMRGAMGNDGEGLALRIASAMDGTRRDDELVCEFEKPLEELAQLVRKTLNQEVLSLYTT